MTPPPDPRFFTQDWTITLPSHQEPTLKFIRLTPAYIDIYAKITTDYESSDIVVVKAPEASPTTTSTEPSTPKPDDEVNYLGIRTRALNRYKDSKTRHHSLDCLVMLNSQIVGSGGIMQLTDPGVTPSLANVGIMLTPAARGKGIGKTFMQVLLRLSCEFQIDVIEAGTMKGNVAMRALARSLGLEETDEVKVVEGSGVVAELLYKDIQRERWRGLEWCVEFREGE